MMMLKTHRGTISVAVAMNNELVDAGSGASNKGEAAFLCVKELIRKHADLVQRLADNGALTRADITAMLKLYPVDDASQAEKMERE